MKTRLLYFLCAALFGSFLASYSGGVASATGQDRTGGPLSSGSCGSCHSAGAFSPSMSIVVKDAGNNSVTEYIPGESYTLEFTLSNGSGSPAGFGMQGVALLSDNSNAGDMTSAVSSNTQLRTLSGSIEYVEHQGINASGVFQVLWTAPVSGSGNVTIYGGGIAASGSAGTGNDGAVNPQSLVLSEAVVTTVSYPNSTYCADGADPTPIITGTTGGSFESTAGLVINSSTGVVDLSASTLGTYVVEYIFNATADTTSTSIEVIATDVTNITYGTSTVCANDINQTPLITGVSAGTFSATPAGLVFEDNLTGEIDLGASAVGTYTITFTTNGTCPGSDDATLTIEAVDDASFSYSSSTYCADGVDPMPTITGTTGGSFTTFPFTGLAINSSTGAIDLDASTPGTYDVVYNTTGNCASFSSQVVTVTAAGDASFEYDNLNFCSNEGTVLPTITGISGGTFSVDAAVVLNASTGAVDLEATGAGAYVIYYEVTGNCPAEDSTDLIITAQDVAAIAYSKDTLCTTDGGANAPVITGVEGGFFEVSPSGNGVTINDSTGLLTFNNPSVGSYAVTYSTAGICPDTVGADLEIVVCSGVAELEKITTLTVAPNPNNGSFSIESSEIYGEAQIEIYDLMGRQIYTQLHDIQLGEPVIMPMQLSQGCYFLHVKKADKVASVRINVYN